MWVIFLIVGLIILLALITVAIYIRYIRDFWKFLEVPHEKPHRLIDIFKKVTGHDPHDEQSELDHYQQLYRQFKGTGPFCGFYNLLQPRLLVLDFELMRQILIKNFANFNDRGIYHNTKLDALSCVLYNLSGTKWQGMRLKLEPIFAKEQMQYLFDSIDSESNKLLEAFELAYQQQIQTGYVDIENLTRRYVLSTIANCVFGLDIQKTNEHSFQEFEEMAMEALTTRRHGSYTNTLLYRYPNLGRKLGFETTTAKVQEYFSKLLRDVVTQRERCDSDIQDYLQLLINVKIQEFASHESEKDNDSKELKEYLLQELTAHAFSFLKVGFEPTAKTLACVLYELALNQNIQKSVKQELDDALKQYNDTLNYDCVRQLKFMGQVISETIRMHPIKPYLTRRTLNDYIVPNHPKYLIRKDMYVIIPTYAIHNDPDVYPEPLLFKPERFSAEENRTREQCAWLGFGVGPRSCIGIHFAQLQIRVALAKLLLQYNFTPNLKKLLNKHDDRIILRIDALNTTIEGIESKSMI